MKMVYVGEIPMEAVESLLKSYKKILVDAIDNRDFDTANSLLWRMQSMYESTQENKQEDDA